MVFVRDNGNNNNNNSWELLLLCVRLHAWGGFIFMFYNLFLIGGQLFYNIVLSLYINMNPPIGIHMPLSGTSVPSLTTSHPSWLSQSPRFEFPASYSVISSKQQGSLFQPSIVISNPPYGFRSYKPFHSYYKWGPSQALFTLKTESRSQGWTLAKP